MSAQNGAEHEERAIDALIVAALCQIPDPPATTEELAAFEQYLTEEDISALDAGKDCRMKRTTPDAAEECRTKDGCAELLAGAMNRGSDPDALSEKAREEMERRLRDALEQEDKTDDGREDD